jgi:hypothetical protein
MATSKSICKHLFDVPFRIKLVDDPLRSSKRVASNRVLNQKKAESLKRGREAEKEDGNDAAKRPRSDSGNTNNNTGSNTGSQGVQVDNNLASHTTRHSSQQPFHLGHALHSSPPQQMRPDPSRHSTPYAAGQLTNMPPPQSRPRAADTGNRHNGYGSSPVPQSTRQPTTSGGPGMMSRAQGQGLDPYDPRLVVHGAYYGARVEQPSTTQTSGERGNYPLPGQTTGPNYHGNSTNTQWNHAPFLSSTQPPPEATGNQGQTGYDSQFDDFINHDAFSQAGTSTLHPNFGMAGNLSGSGLGYAQNGAYHDPSAPGTMAQGHVPSNRSTDTEEEYQPRV